MEVEADGKLGASHTRFLCPPRLGSGRRTGGPGLRSRGPCLRCGWGVCGRRVSRVWRHVLLVKPVKILPSSQFSIKLVRPLTEQTMPQSAIINQGIQTAKVIDGAVLEAAIEWSGHYLAFVTDDIPNEESLRIYLFDSGLNLVDSATLSAIYATGSFRHLELLPPNALRFAFFGDTTWELELLAHQELALPLMSDPKGVSRPLSFHRRFRIHGHPKPACR